jgi:hypothetical protein
VRLPVQVLVAEELKSQWTRVVKVFPVHCYCPELEFIFEVVTSSIRGRCSTAVERRKKFGNHPNDFSG